MTSTGPEQAGQSSTEGAFGYPVFDGSDDAAYALRLLKEWRMDPSDASDTIKRILGIKIEIDIDQN